MRNHVHGDHIGLQLELKTHSKCNSYATALYKYNDLIN
jgi:hypothetical protein